MRVNLRFSKPKECVPVALVTSVLKRMERKSVHYPFVVCKNKHLSLSVAGLNYLSHSVAVLNLVANGCMPHFFVTDLVVVRREKNVTVQKTYPTNPSGSPHCHYYWLITD